jgi:hypothetical protein
LDYLDFVTGSADEMFPEISCKPTGLQLEF